MALKILMKINLFPWLVFSLLAGRLSAEPSLYISGKEYPSGPAVGEWAQYTITTSGNVTVKNGANVNFGAGESIKLTSGFKVEKGGTFKVLVASASSYNPGGYYNGITPTLALIAGDQQYGQIGQFNLLPFDIAIWNAAGTAPLVNAPVLLTVSYGGGMLSKFNGVNGPVVLTKNLTLTTDVDGTVKGYYQHGPYELISSSIQVVAGTRKWQFSTCSYSTTGPNADTDGDGVSNASETVLGMNTTQTAQASTAPELQVHTP